MTTALKVLLVEDHAADRRLLEEALSDCKIAVDLNTVSDGEQAIRYVKKTGNYKSAERPDLIILDLNMPRKDGHQFLEEMQGFLKKEEIPVVLLTVSDNPTDHDRALDCHMNYFMSKPVNSERLQQILNAVTELWTPGCCH
ncbi:MAG: response regulator [Candidatus Obscuribacterales bacterium]|nr:response regulator [Candidatus Obscuribacterales bacterium]